MSDTPSVPCVAAGTPHPPPAPQHGAGVGPRVSGSNMSITDDYLAEIIITARIAQRIASVQRLYEATKDGCFDQCRLDFALRRQRACERDLNLCGLHLLPDGDLAWIEAAS